MEKNIAIVVPGASEEDARSIFDVKLMPGTTVREVREDTRLNRFHIRRKSGGFLDPHDNLYSLVQDGEELWAAPDMDVG
jgi:hypothetical protein